MKKKILLTRRWPEAVEKHLCERYDTTLNETDTPLAPEALRAALSDYDALLPTVTDKLDASVFDNPNIRTQIIANFGVGFSHIDIEAARNANLVITNTPDVLSECTADLAITLMLMATRRAGEGERELRAGQWTGWRPTHMVGSKLSGKTLGIIGYGRIGQETAKRAHYGFDMPIVAFNRSRIAPEVLAKNNARQVDTVEELLAQSDVVSLHCPGGDANRHLINAERLELMKNSACLVNTARGEVVDDQALALALSNGEIASAGLDVFDGEPNINLNLCKLDNAVLLPHLGSATQETRDGMGFRVADNLAAFFAGDKPGDQVVP